MSELKPCPFCGAKANIRKVQITEKSYKPIISVPDCSIGYNDLKNKWKYKVVCNKCKGMVGLYASEKTAIISWNRRTTDETVEKSEEHYIKHPCNKCEEQSNDGNPYGSICDSCDERFEWEEQSYDFLKMLVGEKQIGDCNDETD